MPRDSDNASATQNHESFAQKIERYLGTRDNDQLKLNCTSLFRQSGQWIFYYFLKNKDYASLIERLILRLGAEYYSNLCYDLSIRFDRPELLQMGLKRCWTNNEFSTLVYKKNKIIGESFLKPFLGGFSHDAVDLFLSQSTFDLGCFFKRVPKNPELLLGVLCRLIVEHKRFALEFYKDLFSDSPSIRYIEEKEGEDEKLFSAFYTHKAIRMSTFNYLQTQLLYDIPPRSYKKIRRRWNGEFLEIISSDLTISNNLVQKFFLTANMPSEEMESFLDGLRLPASASKKEAEAFVRRIGYLLPYTIICKFPEPAIARFFQDNSDHFTKYSARTLTSSNSISPLHTWFSKPLENIQLSLAVIESTQTKWESQYFPTIFFDLLQQIQRLSLYRYEGYHKKDYQFFLNYIFIPMLSRQLDNLLILQLKNEHQLLVPMLLETHKRLRQSTQGEISYYEHSLVGVGDVENAHCQYAKDPITWSRNFLVAHRQLVTPEMCLYWIVQMVDIGHKTVVIEEDVDEDGKTHQCRMLADSVDMAEEKRFKRDLNINIAENIAKLILYPRQKNQALRIASTDNLEPSQLGIERVKMPCQNALIVKNSFFRASQIGFICYEIASTPPPKPSNYALS